MKKFILPLSILMTLSACTPKDVAVIQKDDRERFNSQKARGKGSNNAQYAGEVKDLGSFGLASYMMEKQGEVLQILAASNLNRSEALGPYIVEDLDEQKLVLAAKDYTNKLAEFNLVQNAKWDNFVVRNETGIIALFATSSGEGGVVETLSPIESSQMKDFAVTVIEKTASIQALRAKDDVGSSDITYTSEGVMEVTKFGVKEPLPFNLKIKMRVKSQSYQEALLEITKSEATLDMLRNNGKGNPWNVAIKNDNGSVIQFKNEKDCPAILGKAYVTTSKKTLLFDDQSVTVAGVKHKTLHAACGQRPTVDLSRILVY